MLTKKPDFLYGQLTEDIISAAYVVYNKLGYGHPEKLYHKAFAIELKKRNLHFCREKYAKIYYDEEIVGRYFLDFLVENKVAVEFKVRREIYESDWLQLLNYLKAENLQVGLLIVFSKHRLLLKRIANQISNK